MDWSAIVGGAAIIVTVFNGIISYWVNQISKNQDTLVADQKILTEKLQHLEVKLPNEYVKKADLDYRLSRIEHILDQIMIKLDNKQDKMG